VYPSVPLPTKAAHAGQADMTRHWGAAESAAATDEVSAFAGQTGVVSLPWSIGVDLALVPTTGETAL